jgi:23S rRNA pseudouridine1911/1915/1917 synthase
MAPHADTPRKLVVEASGAGSRLDVFLAERLGLSRAQARRLLRRGAVEVGGRTARERDKGRTLVEGDQLEVARFRSPEHQRIPPQPGAALSVLASGAGWLAVDKPAGTAVHPFDEEETGTVVGAVVARHPEVQGVGEGGLRSGVVHRLDVDTSGVLLVATEQTAWRRLRQAFQEHRVEKVYRALVAGRMKDEGYAEVGMCMARHRPARVRIVGDAEDARGVWRVRMSWRPLEVFDRASLVEVRPVTGFLHQIRAVLAQAGHPLLGDRIYAPPGVAAAAPRHMLHASRVAFEEIEAESPLPPDFALGDVA